MRPVVICEAPIVAERLRYDGPMRHVVGAVLIIAVVLALPTRDALGQFIRAPFMPSVPDEPKQTPPTVTPTLTLSEEFNDNVFLDNLKRRSDFVGAASPGLSFSLETPDYGLTTSYRLTAEFYARHPELDNTDRNDFTLEGFYRVTPDVTLALRDQFTSGLDTPSVTAEGVSTGRDLTFSNSAVGTLTWAIDRLTGIRLVGAHTLQRFESPAARNSDVYRAQLSADRTLTPALTGTASYEFAAFDIQHDPTMTYTHTPRFGLRYNLTDRLVARLGAGPTIAIGERPVRITPAVTASLEQTFSWGMATVLYDRAVGTAGGLGGTTDNQIISARLTLAAPVPGLFVELAPRYTIFESAVGRAIDIRAASVSFQASYQIASWLTAILSYSFFHQRQESPVPAADATTATEVDQSRVFFGLQIGYPVPLK